MSAINGAAVIGMRMGDAHASAYADNGVNVVALCDLDETQLAESSQKHSADLATNDFRDLLARDDVSVVSVASPDLFHVEHCVAAMRAGKDVLCEKPMALSVADCSEIIRAADETGRVCMVGQVCRFAPGFVKAKGLVDAGEIGELFFVESEYAHNYERVRGHLPVDWRLDPRRHAVIGGGCHAVDLLRWVAGGVKEVFAYANHKNLPDWPTDDCTIAALKFDTGVVGKVLVGIGVRRPYTMRSVFYGTRGTIICDNTSPAIRLAKATDEHPDPDWQSLPVDVASHNVHHEVAQFLSVLRGDTASYPDAREGARTVAVCCAIVESACAGNAVTPVAF